MSWVKDALEGLREKDEAKVRPHGGSMRGRIESGQLVTIVPAAIEDLKPDDVVFVRWMGNYLLHLVKEKEADKILIGNNLGKINGWVVAEDVIGRAIAVED